MPVSHPSIRLEIYILMGTGQAYRCSGKPRKEKSSSGSGLFGMPLVNRAEAGMILFLLQTARTLRLCMKSRGLLRVKGNGVSAS